MDLIEIEKAIRNQIPLRDFHSLRAVKNLDFPEEIPLIIICGLWSEHNKNKGQESFCKYYNISKSTYTNSVKKFKKSKFELKEVYKQYQVIDNSLNSLFYNFKKLTGYDLIKLVSVKKVSRVMVKNGAPKLPYNSIRMALKEQLVRNYLAA